MSSLKVCAYIYTKGKKKDTRCVRNCRGTLCNFHKPKKMQYLVKYQEKKRKEDKLALVDDSKKSVMEKIESATCIDNLPCIRLEKNELLSLKADYVKILKKINGAKIFMDQDDLYDIQKVQCGKCTCDKSPNGSCYICDKECSYCFRLRNRQYIKYKHKVHGDSNSRVEKYIKAMKIRASNKFEQYEHQRKIIKAINNKYDKLSKIIQ